MISKNFQVHILHDVKRNNQFFINENYNYYYTFNTDGHKKVFSEIVEICL